MAYVLSTKAYQNMILHAAKYPSLAVGGLLIGSKSERKVLEAIPIVHSQFLPTPLVQVAIEQVEIYSKRKGMQIIGVYFANEANVDVLIPSSIEAICNEIDTSIGGGSIIIRVCNHNQDESSITKIRPIWIGVLFFRQWYLEGNTGTQVSGR
jgi:hypothetical protein